MNFTDINESTLREILEKQQGIEIEVSEAILGFSEIDKNYFSRPREVPPTPVAFIKESFVKLIFQSANDVKGRWMRFVLFVYATNGKILFTKKSNDVYNAQVLWSK